LDIAEQKYTDAVVLVVGTAVSCRPSSAPDPSPERDAPSSDPFLGGAAASPALFGASARWPANGCTRPTSIGGEM